jgi:hypothetical protein
VKDASLVQNGVDWRFWLARTIARRELRRDALLIPHRTVYRAPPAKSVTPDVEAAE